MKLLVRILLLIILTQTGLAQDTAITLKPEMILKVDRVIPLQLFDGWLFRKGNNPDWAKTNIDLESWEKRKPAELSEKLADKNGKLECWLRIKIRMDSSLKYMPFDIIVNGWAATAVYVDGTLFKSYGNTGANGKPFREYNSNDKLPLTFNVDMTTDHVIAVHFVDFVSSAPPFHLRSNLLLKYFIALVFH